MTSDRRIDPRIRARHRARLITARIDRWLRRLLFIIGGSIVGAVAAGLAIAAEAAQDGFFHVRHWNTWAAFALTPIAFGLCVYVARRWFPNSQGSGIPQAIAAHRLSDPHKRAALVSLRIALGKIGLTLFGLLCGASAGREGPTVQIGASVMFSLSRWTRRQQAGLIVAGASAGVAAAFNTPLAGIMFGIEELTRSFERHTSALIVSTVVAAGFTAIALLGNYTYFGSTSGTLEGSRAALIVLICGIAGGLGGGLFSRIVLAAAQGFRGRAGRFVRERPVVFAVLCGLGVGLCDLLSGNSSVHGTGYTEVSAALAGAQPLAPQYGILKFLATTLTSISTIPGGIFSPSLAIGAGIGANVASLFSGVDVGAVMLVAMVAYLAGVVQAPITAFVIVTEMSNHHLMVIPLMAAALVGHAASRLVCHEGVYHALARGLLRPDGAASKPPIATPA